MHRQMQLIADESRRMLSILTCSQLQGQGRNLLAEDAPDEALHEGLRPLQEDYVGQLERPAGVEQVVALHAESAVVMRSRSAAQLGPCGTCSIPISHIGASSMTKAIPI